MSSQPTPRLEDDLNHARPSPKDGKLASHDIPSPRSRTSIEKGKAKQLEEGAYDDDNDDQDTIANSYPPTTDEAAETRRVEENLRRWEMAERERRRAARESVHVSSRGGGPSLLGEVTRRASVLLSNRQSGKASPGGLGNHRALNSRDSIDAVPLNIVDQSPRVSENPFLHPSEREPRSSHVSSFDESKEQSIIMSEVSDIPFPCSPRAFDSETPSSQPTMLSRTSTLVSPPRPSPEETRIHTAPMKATPAPTLHRGPSEPEQEVRWWHEWLCGCSEGPDRGGDFQAGRTNPFE